MDEQRKRLQKQLREFEKYTDVPQDILSSFRERWQQQLQDVEHKRNDLLPEHQESAEEVSKYREHPG